MSTDSPAYDAKLTSLLWAGPERAPEIAKLHATLFDPAWDAPSIASLLDNPGATALLAAHGFDRQMIGFVIGQVAADEAEILSIGVSAPFQRHGVARKLVDGLYRAAAKAGARKLYLEVAADNVAALALYDRAGFKEAGRRKGYYERAGRAAVDGLNLAMSI